MKRRRFIQDLGALLGATALAAAAGLSWTQQPGPTTATRDELNLCVFCPCNSVGASKLYLVVSEQESGDYIARLHIRGATQRKVSLPRHDGLQLFEAARQHQPGPEDNSCLVFSGACRFSGGASREFKYFNDVSFISTNRMLSLAFRRLLAQERNAPSWIKATMTFL